MFVFNNNERIYYRCSYSGDRYSHKDLLFLILSIIFGTMTLVTLYLAFVYNLTIIIPSIICAGGCLYLFKIYSDGNKNRFKKNEIINFDIYITNERFIYFDKNSNKCFDFPIMNFNKVLVRDAYTSIYPKELVLYSNHDLLTKFPIDINNSLIEIDKDCIVLRKIPGVYLLLYKLKFLLNAYKNNYKDLYDINNYLEFGENIVYEDMYHSHKDDSNIRIKLFMYLFPIVFIILFFIDNFVISHDALSILAGLAFCIYISVFIYKGRFVLNKKNNYSFSLKYFITNKRVLFFDYNNVLLYAFDLTYLDFINISDYDKVNDIGDIYLSNYMYSCFVKHNLNIDQKYRDNTYDNFFPSNYLCHYFQNNIDIMNCPKIRLYNVKNPNEVVRNYLNPHLKDEKPIKELLKKEHMK